MFGQNLRSRVSDRRNGGAHSSRARLATGENKARDEVGERATGRREAESKWEEGLHTFHHLAWLALAQALGVCFPPLTMLVFYCLIDSFNDSLFTHVQLVSHDSNLVTHFSHDSLI